MNIHTLRVLTYPYVTISTLNRLPKLPGIYYVMQGYTCYYVGLAGEHKSSLYARWLLYEPHKEIYRLNMGSRLHYRVITNRKRLRHIEALEIKRLNPIDNVQRPDPNQYAPKFAFCDVLYFALGLIVFILYHLR